LREGGLRGNGPGVQAGAVGGVRAASAVNTKPVACAVEFHSVSNARVESTSIDTTLPAMRSSVSAQSGLPSTAAGCATAAGGMPTPPGFAGRTPAGGGAAGGPRGTAGWGPAGLAAAA